MTTLHGRHLFMQKNLPNKISKLFFEALEKIDPISGQPTYSNLTEICEVLYQTPLIIPYYEENGIHNLFSLIQDTMTYTMDYTAIYPLPLKPEIYDVPIKD